MHPLNAHHVGRIERLASIGETMLEITHELNNQLTTLLGYATLLRETRATGAGKGAAHLDGLVKACGNCCAMSRSILEYARGGGGERFPRDICAVIARPVEVKSAAFESAEITVRIRFPKERMEAMVDEFQVQQVVFNILHNAHHELMKVKRRMLDIHGRRENGRAVISFRNSGPGIRNEHTERIFEPFFTTKPAGEGTGLGLSISRRIVEQHGGTLTLEQAPAGGATFVMSLPLIPTPR